MDTDLYERQGKEITNFSHTLPIPSGDLAQELTKDPYNFDFLSIRKGYNERQLKDTLLHNITRFLVELGTGFAYVGREYRLQIGQTEKFIDLLFYNLNIRCYVVVEVKIDKFDSADIGQLGTYVTAVNHILCRKDLDNPTIGLLICKTRIICWRSMHWSQVVSLLVYQSMSYRNFILQKLREQFQLLRKLRQSCVINKAAKKIRTA